VDIVHVVDDVAKIEHKRRCSRPPGACQHRF
jgi:hypothetical protein